MDCALFKIAREINEGEILVAGTRIGIPYLLKTMYTVFPWRPLILKNSNCDPYFIFNSKWTPITPMLKALINLQATSIYIKISPFIITKVCFGTLYICNYMGTKTSFTCVHIYIKAVNL